MTTLQNKSPGVPRLLVYISTLNVDSANSLVPYDSVSTLHNYRHNSGFMEKVDSSVSMLFGLLYFVLERAACACLFVFQHETRIASLGDAAMKAPALWRCIPGSFRTTIPPFVVHILATPGTTNIRIILWVTFLRFHWDALFDSILTRRHTLAIFLHQKLHSGTDGCKHPILVIIKRIDTPHIFQYAAWNNSVHVSDSLIVVVVVVAFSAKFAFLCVCEPRWFTIASFKI